MPFPHATISTFHSSRLSWAFYGDFVYFSYLQPLKGRYLNWYKWFVLGLSALFVWSVPLTFGGAVSEFQIEINAKWLWFIIVHELYLHKPANKVSCGHSCRRTRILRSKCRQTISSSGASDFRPQTQSFQSHLGPVWPALKLLSLALFYWAVCASFNKLQDIKFLCSQALGPRIYVSSLYPFNGNSGN